MSDDTSIPAFPSSVTGAHHYYRMSLRDYFAGEALNGILSDNALRGSPLSAADLAYRQADAMIERRQK
jgi:hypothetical protein